jgi:hypothetical protein
VKNIPFLYRALVALLFVTLFSIFDERLFGVDLLTTSFNIAFGIVAWLFVGHAYWRQTVRDMRASFDDPDNLRMLTQLSSHSGSMYIPMLTVIITWPAFALLAAIMAMVEDTVRGPLTYP